MPDTLDSRESHDEFARRRFVYLVRTCFVASLAGLLFGFDTAVISGTITGVTSSYSLSQWMVGWFASSALVGCVVGALFAGGLSDRFGRKALLVWSAVLFLVSAVFSMVPNSLSVLLWARVIGGLGVGAASVVAPVYISEFSPASMRGRLVALYQLCIVFGILAAYASNYLIQQLSLTLDSAELTSQFVRWVVIEESWRAMFGAEIIPASLFLLLACLAPESPRWDILHGNEKLGAERLRAIEPPHIAQQRFQEIRETKADRPLPWTELLHARWRMPLLVCVGLSFFGQLSGVNVVVYFGPSILESAGFKENSALLFQVGFGAINLIFTILAMTVIDSLGRRPLLIGGMGVVALTLAVAGGLFWVLESEGSRGLTLDSKQFISLAIVAVLALYFAAVAFSICAVIWVLSPELLPNQLRGRGMSLATFANWSTNALSVLLFPIFTAKFSTSAAFLCFAAVCLVATGFFYRCVPETRDKTLEEIEASWV